MSRKHERRRRSPERTGENAGELAGAEGLTLAQREAIERAIVAGELQRGQTFTVERADAGDDQRIAGEDAERLRLLRMGPVNQVEVDPLALDTEIDRLIASAPPELTADPTAAAPGAGELVSNGVGSWIEVTPGLVAAADIVLLPQWQLRTEEKDQLGRALGDVLDQIFPGGLGDPRWASYVRLAAICSAIAFSRIDPATGKLPPFGRMKLADKPADGQAPAGVDRRAA